MYNSLVTRLCDYILAIFSDGKHLYASNRELERDQTRLLQSLGSRGTKLVTIELPAVDKALCKSLDEGTLHLSGPLTRSGRGEKVPLFMRSIYLRVFDCDGVLRSAPCIESVAFLRQVHSMFKKLKLECSEEAIDEAVVDFVRIERDARSPTLEWDGDSLDVRRLWDISLLDCHSQRCAGDEAEPLLPGLVPEDARDTNVSPRTLKHLQYTADVLACQLGDFHREADAHRPKHGPGVVSNLKKSDSKYAFLEWPRKLEAEFPYDWYASPSPGLDAHRDGDLPWWSNNESPSRLISVPKTQKSPRLIAAEPNQHQWIQQLILRQLEDKIDASAFRYCISLRSQAPSRYMALSGSLDGGYATVDLSSASDRLTCWTVERVFRKNPSFLSRLHASRTRWISNSVSKRAPKFTKLKKLATQGSAVIFPTQTLVYAVVAIAAVTYSMRNPRSLASIVTASKKVQIFGDDIIVPKESLALLRSLLVYLGLKVNDSKTFGVGKFRESCGMDAFMGHDVTPVYVVNPALAVTTRNLDSFVEVGNNFFEAGYWRVAELISSEIGRHRSMLPVKKVGTGAFGLSSFVGNCTAHLCTRMNPDLQRVEFRSLVPYMTVDVEPTNGLHMLHHALVLGSNPEYKRELMTHVVRPKGTRWGWTEQLYSK